MTEPYTATVEIDTKIVKDSSMRYISQSSFTTS